MKWFLLLLFAWASLARFSFADAPTTQPTDSPAVKEVRQAILDRDDSAAKLSLEDFRKTYYTHAMFEKHQKENRNFDAIHFPVARLFTSARNDMHAGKYDDADSFLTDFKNKLTDPNGN